jgi:O-acetyl-ADP-ribose deacetylase (regulator of RNase III)
VAELVLVEGDITRYAADVIVNAANSALAGGGGVDGAIHRAGGPTIMAELDQIRRRIGRCPTGQAVLTGAGDLPAQWVVHAVGPIYRDGLHGEPEMLASCYKVAVRLAAEKAARSIAFPAISAGVYGYPLEQAAEIALRTVAAELRAPGLSLERAAFVLFGRDSFEAFDRALKALRADG